ncbi:MAG: autotransporter assembly complex family protein [Pseudomonadota bacterium]
MDRLHLRYVLWLVCLLVALPVSVFALEVEFRGLSDEDLQSSLEGASLLVETSKAEAPSDARDIIGSALADYRRLLGVLYDNGYFAPEISIKLDGQEVADISPIDPPASVARAVVTVDPGPPFRFGRTRIGPLAEGTVLPSEFALGEPARVSVLQATTRRVISSWRDAGYAKASVAGQSLTAKEATRTLDAEVDVETGPRLRFGALTVADDSSVRKQRILEIAGLPEGQVFSPKELDDAASRLRRTGAFRSVALIEEDVAADGETLPITARISDNKPRRFGFGGEIETIEGLTLSAFWLHRNLFGGAERLRVDGEIGGIGGQNGGVDFSLSTRYDRPATFDADTGLFVITEVESIDDPNIQSNTFSTEVGLERIVDDNRTYRLGVGVRYADTTDALGDTEYFLGYVPAGLTYDYRDNEFDARRGYYADLEVAPFYAFSGIENGILSELDLRGYHTIGENRPTTLAVRFQVGSLIGPSLEDSPSDFLFFSGGGGTVRGQEFQSLGIQIGDNANDIIGGRSFFGIQSEVRLRTAGALGFVGFFDAGYVGEETFPDLTSGEWQTGAGIGVRYDTPIGPIRVDIGVPTSGTMKDAAGFQIYIGIGQAF